MLIREVDFKDISSYKNTKVLPVFMQYGMDCYEIATNLRNSKNSWQIFQKIFYYKFYEQFKEYVDSLMDVRLFTSSKSDGRILFSHTDKTFHNEKATEKDTAIKFGKLAYIAVFQKHHNNLIVLKKIIRDTKLKDFKLFVAFEEDLSKEKFKKDLEAIKKKFGWKRKSPYKIKKGNLVVGHINGLILSEEEKLIKYIRNEFARKILLGDIILNENQEKVLDKYMKIQLNRLILSSSDFKPDYSRTFALGLVRYAMRNYNKRHTGDFWPHFMNDYGIEINPSKQKILHDEFEMIMYRYQKIYEKNASNKIDNITMHSFVADNSAFQLFDYLFDFWRLDLGRNSDNLNNQEEGEEAFKVLIAAMQDGTKDVMAHTSLLLNFKKTKVVFKNRIKRILKLMNESFWNDTKINETGNIINHILNQMITDYNGAFKKEKKYFSKHTSKEK